MYGAGVDDSRIVAAMMARLRKAGLQVKRLKSVDGKRVLLKIRASDARLEDEAERMKLLMRTRDGGWSKFKVSERDNFCGAGYDDVLFRSSDRQSIILHILKTKVQLGGAGLTTGSTLGAVISKMFPLHMQLRLNTLRRGWLRCCGDQLDSRYAFRSSGAGFLNSEGDDADSAADIGRPGLGFDRCCCLRQPLDAIAEYFGETVAFYFAWLQSFTLWLIAPSLAGIILFIFQVRSGSVDHPLLPFYSLFMALWATSFLVFWRRRRAELAYSWGVLSHEAEEITRAEFHGEYVKSEVTGEWEMQYPFMKRLGIQLLLSVR